MIKSKSLIFCASAGGKRREEHEGAGSSPPKPVTRRPTGAGAVSRHAARAPAAPPEPAPLDGSDLDISESLPHDGPVSPEPSGPLAGPAPASPVTDIYAVVRKKKTHQQQVTKKPFDNMAEQCIPRSPVNIPLIKISQTESVERAERGPPQRQPAIVDDAPRRLPRQVFHRASLRLITSLSDQWTFIGSPRTRR